MHLGLYFNIFLWQAKGNKKKQKKELEETTKIYSWLTEKFPHFDFGGIRGMGNKSEATKQNKIRACLYQKHKNTGGMAGQHSNSIEENKKIKRKTRKK